MTETWKPIQMFCPNCGKMNYGYKGIDEKIKYEYSFSKKNGYSIGILLRANNS